MAWKTVAVAQSVDELRALTPSVADIPNGSQVLITIELPVWLPLAHIANLPVEWITQKFLGAIRVTDVRAKGFYTIEIHGIAWGVLWVVVLPALIAVLAGLSAFGIYAWKEIKVAYYETVATQAVTEQAKIEATKKLVEAGYPLSEVTAWLEGIKAPPPEATNIVPGLLDLIKSPISWGIIALVLIGVLVFMGRR